MAKINPLLKDSYLKLIKNSVGVKSYRNFYAVSGGKKKDILKNGSLSCAFFVSSVLVAFGLISKTHMTVEKTLGDLQKNGWREIKSPKPGAILLWEKQKQGRGDAHFHLGFVVGAKQAISNRWEHKCPVAHHIFYGAKNGKPARKIEKIFWHEKLNEP
jgi:hypothetical protein